MVEDTARALASGRRITDREAGGDRRGIPCDRTLSESDPGEIKYTVLVTSHNPNDLETQSVPVTVWGDQPLHWQDITDRAIDATRDVPSNRGLDYDVRAKGPDVRVSITVISASRRC
jgi:hypothetical protein